MNIRYKDVEAARELRLWISQVVIPGALVATFVFSDPQARDAVKTKIENVKYSVGKRFNKKGSF